MSLTFIWNIKSLPHLAFYILYLIKFEAECLARFHEVHSQSREQQQKNAVILPSSSKPEWQENQDLGDFNFGFCE